MRVVVTGATGNVGSALLRALATEDAVDEVVGLARRRPDGPPPPKVRWETGDVLHHDLEATFAGATAVIHLAWLIQPSRDRDTTRAVNVDGTARVLDAVAAAGVPTVVHASSLAAYGPAEHPRDADDRTDETHPTTGIASSFYSRDKVAAERLLDAFERDHPEVRAVRLRPALIFQRSAAQEIRRYFLGPFWPSALVRPGRLPIAPVPRSIRFQVVHADDVADAYRRAAIDPAMRGAYNVAAEPPITPRRFAGVLGGLPVPVPTPVLRLAASTTWRGRVQPTPAGWVDLADQAPLMDTSRLRATGWAPRHDGPAVLHELLAGLRDGAGGVTPPLSAGAGGPFRLREVRTGVGGSSGV